MDIISRPRNTLKKANELPYISILVKDQRIELGLSQKELTEKIGLGLKTLRKIEQGDLNVTYEKLNYLLNFFGMTLGPKELVTSPKEKHERVFDKDHIIQMLSHLYPIFKLKYGVTELALFGSYAKGGATIDSDIDILINFDSKVSFETEGEIQLILENMFKGASIDLTLKDNLHRAFIEDIEESKIDVA